MENKKTILIIDDDSFLLDMYALKFSKSDFAVTTALGSLSALEQLRAGLVPDVILVDIMMPVMDGFELMEKMREEGLASSAVRVILSNRGQASDISRGESMGVAGYIVKASSTPSEVIEQVKVFIDKSKK